MRESWSCLVGSAHRMGCPQEEEAGCPVAKERVSRTTWKIDAPAQVQGQEEALQSPREMTLTTASL